MLRFKTIRFKNFLSTGNAFTEIQLDQHSTTLILGENGSGKSTILDALTYALFGKSYRRINKPGLINSVNEKAMVVEIEFTTQGKEYKIVRGMRPNVFEIYCNGIMLNQDSTTKDYQEHLEKNVLRMSYKTFTQIVILGSATFTPFMQLTPADRRAVIEDVLDIEIFSTMNIITKQKMVNNRESLENVRIAILGKQEKKTFIEKTLISLRSNNEEREKSLNDQINQHTSEIENLEADIEVLENERNSLLQHAAGIAKEREKHKNLIAMEAKIENNLSRKRKDISFYEDNDSCPTCKQMIEETFKATIVSAAKEKATEFEGALSKMTQTIEKCVNHINEMDKYVTRANSIAMEITEKQSKIAYYEKMLSSFKDELDTINQADNLLKTNEKELRKTAAEIKSLEDQKEELLNQKQYLEIALNLLKDGGIKTKIIKQYLPVINKHINKYLSIMGLYINFEINEQFEETIKSRFRDNFSYNNFSEGEKMRINLAILLTWRDISRLRNMSYTNLLMMDEVLDSSMDINGLDGFMKLVGDSQTNVFIISHRAEHMSDKFDQTIRFRKIKNYSQMEI